MKNVSQMQDSGIKHNKIKNNSDKTLLSIAQAYYSAQRDYDHRVDYSLDLNTATKVYASIDLDCALNFIVKLLCTFFAL